ncbi:MAG: purine-nucleoside phosphorylase [Synergistales bacterium]|nr:purine-nucleoside phosphorylase [Synergistales bacterium]
MESKTRVDKACSLLQERIGARPRVGLVLGSGLGGLADFITGATVVPYEEIPAWPHSTAPGHEGRLIAGELGGVSVLAMQGRAHAYEGYSLEEVVFPVRVMGQLGISVYIATNASGGIHSGLNPGDLMLIKDHINLMGANPLVGPNEASWGDRFPDMSTAYDPGLQAVAEETAAEQGIQLKKGVYVAFGGPSFETPAEIRMAGMLGADAVGMSTVPEVIAANHMGMKVCAISCVANYAAGISRTPLSHEEVLREVGRSANRLQRLVSSMLGKLGEDGA